MAFKLPWHIAPHDPNPVKLVKKAAFSINLSANGGFFVWSLFGAHTALELGAGVVALAVALNEVGHLLEEMVAEG
jgi:hypothetical protein